MILIHQGIVSENEFKIEIYQDENKRIIILCSNVEPVVVMINQGEAGISGPNLVYDMKELILEERVKTRELAKKGII